MSEHQLVPNLLDLIKQRAAAGEDDARQFFNIARRPNETWLRSLIPGVDASQRVLSVFIAEQTTGDATLGDIALQQAKDTDAAERARLCREIFGEDDDLEVLRNISTSIKSKPHVRLDFVETASGRRELTVSDPEFSQVDPNADIRKPEKIEEPEGGLIPAQKPPSNQLESLVSTLRGRVRVSGDASIEEVLNGVVNGDWTRKVVLLEPMYRPINPHVSFGLQAQIRRQPWLGMMYETDTIIQRARNVLAARFLKSEAEWSIWHDDDMIAPFADPHFFFDSKRLACDPTFIKPEFVNVLGAQRLLNAQKSIVGAVYHMRNQSAESRMVIQPALHPRNEADKQLVARLHREGPFNEVAQVGYVGLGFAAVHRSVYRDIMNKFPERQPSKAYEPYDFFGEDRAGDGAEDIFFCGLAQQSGHASFLDCGLWCAHIGSYAFMPPKRNV